MLLLKMLNSNGSSTLEFCCYFCECLIVCDCLIYMHALVITTLFILFFIDHPRLATDVDYVGSCRSCGSTGHHLGGFRQLWSNESSRQ